MRKVLYKSILSSVLLLLGNAVAYAQASSLVFKDNDNQIDVSQFQSKVTVSGARPVAGDIISGVIRDAEGPMNGANVVERDSLNRVVAYSFCDSLGNFSFRLVNPDDRLQVTYIGFYSVDCEFSGNRFEIEMKPNIDGRFIIEDWQGMPGPVIPREEDSFPLLLLNGKLAAFPDGSRDKLNSFDFDRYYNDFDKLARLYGINKSDIKEVRTIKNTEAVAEWNVWGINGVLDVIITTIAQSVSEADHESVDLGLSVKWATCNVGADKPEDSGDFFAWGETSPYYESLDPLVWKEGKEKGYDRASASDNYNNRRVVFGTKQPAPASTSAKYSIETGAKRQLDPEDDAAHVNWGGDWRMPTIEECKELVDSCIWDSTTINGVKGYEVRSKTNGNSIFIPAVGSFAGISNNPSIGYTDEENNFVEERFHTGCYWSSTLSPNYSYRASMLFFSVNKWFNEHRVDITYREWGCPVRPVCP